MAENLVFHPIIREWNLVSVFLASLCDLSIHSMWLLMFPFMFRVFAVYVECDAISLLKNKQHQHSVDGGGSVSPLHSIHNFCVAVFFLSALRRFICFGYVHFTLYILYYIYMHAFNC